MPPETQIEVNSIISETHSEMAASLNELNRNARQSALWLERCPKRSRTLTVGMHTSLKTMFRSEWLSKSRFPHGVQNGESPTIHHVDSCTCWVTTYFVRIHSPSSTSNANNLRYTEITSTANPALLSGAWLGVHEYTSNGKPRHPSLSARKKLAAELKPRWRRLQVSYCRINMILD